MIPADRGPSQALGAASDAETTGEGKRLGQVVEANLPRHVSPLSRPHPDFVSEGGLEPVAGIAQRRLLLRVELPARRSSLWLAGQLGPVLGLSDRPAVPR